MILLALLHRPRPSPNNAKKALRKVQINTMNYVEYRLNPLSPREDIYLMDSLV